MGDSIAAGTPVGASWGIWGYDSGEFSSQGAYMVS